MIVGKGILLLVSLLLLPFLGGTWITGYPKTKKEPATVLSSWTAGFVVLLALGEILFVPATFLKLSFHTVLTVYGGLVLLLAVSGAVWNRKQLLEMCKNGIQSIGSTPLVVWLLVILVAGQMLVSVFYMHEDSDDAFYVATAVTTLEEDSLFQVDPYTGEDYTKLPARYVLSPFPVFYAAVGKLTGLHPTIIAHTVLPAVLLLFVYSVYWLIAREMFEYSRERAGWMVLLAAVYIIYSGYTTSTQGSMMLLRLWQGKALLAAALLPLIFYVFLRLVKKKETWMDWAFMIALQLACCFVSSMGIMLGAILYGCCSLVAAAMRKSPVLLLKLIPCAVPNLVLALAYVVIR